MEAIIFDIDGTLADCSHRVHHVRGGKRDWDAFFAEMDADPLVAEMGILASIVASKMLVILTTGRPEKYREITERWLSRHGVPYGLLHMRSDGDFRADAIVKKQMLDAIRADGYDILLVVDDRQSVVDMWRENGLICLQCAPGYEEGSSSASPVLTLMVGPSGAGKSTWLKSAAAESHGIKPAHIVSSDQIREDLCGNFRDQTKNDEVFSALHAVVKARLKHGLPTVVDATNLRRKDRLGVVDLAPDGCLVRYVVIDRPMDEKRRDAGWRAELPFDLLEKHAQTFRSQIKDILGGDGRQDIVVIDARRLK